MNLGNGNLTLSVPIVSWNNGVSFALIFNSQTNGSSSAPIGRKWTHTYRAFLTASGNHQILTDTDGSEWTFTWNGSGYNSPAGNLDRLVLNPNGSRSLFRHGSDEEWRFNSNGRLQWIKDKHGKQTNLTYASGRLVEVKDPYDRTLTISYTYQSGHPQTITLTDPQSRVWTLHYDSSGRLVELDYPTLNSTTYDIHFTYNANHNVTKWTDRLDQEWIYSYGSSDPNVLVSFKDPDENEWTAIYEIIEDDSPSVEVGYTRWVDPTDVWVEYGFSSVGNNRRITHGPAGGSSPTFTTLMTYNNAHQVTQRTDPAGLVWEYTYDSRGNRTWMKEPNGAETTYTYYTNTDNLHTVTNALNQTWTYTYTNRNDVKTIEDPEEALTTYEYEYETVQDGRGVLVKMIDPLERETELEYYNAAGYDYLKKVIAPGGYWREFTYDTMGRLSTRVVQVSGGTQTTSYTYDNWGRLTTIDYPTSTDVSYTYDAENRRLSMTDGIGTQAYEYDAWGRVTRKTNCCGGDITASYDPAGRRLTLTDPDEREITYEYDALGRLVWAEDTRGRMSFFYDSAGRLEKQVYPTEYAWVYAYDPGSGELISKEYRDPEEEVEQAWKYQYDALHRLIENAESPSGDVVSITYDDENRMIFEERTGSQGYLRVSSYLPDGAIDSETIDSSAASRWYVYGYDTAGRMQTTTDLIQGTTSTYSWDAHQLTRWDSDDRTYARVFTYDEESRITKVERLMYDSQQLLPGLEYQYTGDGHRHSMQDHPRSYESREACGSLVVWYRENGSDWQPAVQSYGIQGCLSCVSNTWSENRRAWYDAYWLPNTYEPETPALCAVACICAGVCLYALIRPCVDQCRGSENLFDCLKSCLSDRLSDASLPVKLVCGGCVIGCAFCLLRVIFPPRAPSPSPPAPHPVEPPQENPHRPVPIGPIDRDNPPHDDPPRHPHPQNGGDDPLEWKPVDTEWCLGICHDRCNNLHPTDPFGYNRCMEDCLDRCTGYGWYPPLSGTFPVRLPPWRLLRVYN